MRHDHIDNALLRSFHHALSYSAKHRKPIAIITAGLLLNVAGCNTGSGTTALPIDSGAHASDASIASQAIARNGHSNDAATQSLCIGGTQYAAAQDDEFATDTALNSVPTSINPSPGPSAMWSTEFSFGRSNNAGADDAFYADPSITPYFNPFSFSNGALNIEAEPVPAAHAKDAIIGGHHWLSGVLEGKALTYGYVEVSAEEPNLQGFWPAPIWLLGYNGADGKGNGYSEFDGNEIFGNALGTSVVQQTQILNNANPRAANVVRTTVAPNPQTSFHTYGILWTPATVSFYIDRVATSKAWPNVATGPMNPIINLQVFTQTTWAPGPASQTPQYMKLKYFRWYQSANTSCSPTVVAPPSSSPTPTPTPTLSPAPTPTPTLAPTPAPSPSAGASARPNHISVVQVGPVVKSAAWLNATATLAQAPANGDMLILLASVDNGFTPPPGWSWLATPGSGSGTLNLMYGIVGQNGLAPATSYVFGGNTALAQIVELRGMNASIAPAVSANPTDYGTVRTRSLSIPAAGGMTIVVWSGRSDTATGGISSITDALPSGQTESRHTNILDDAMPGGSALSLVASKITSDAYSAGNPFSVTATIGVGNAPHTTADGDIIWIHP